MRLPLFMGRNVRRNKVNTMQFVVLQRHPRQSQMSAMYRIEGAAEESNVHGSGLPECNSPA